MRKQLRRRATWSSITAACLSVSLAACGDSSEPELGTGVGATSAGSGTPAPAADTAGTSPSAAGATSQVGSAGGGASAAPSASAPSSDAGAAPTANGASDTNGSSWCQAKAIFDKNCVACHDGKGSSGSPMGLTTYEAFQAAAPLTSGKKVFEAVGARMHDATRPMPPKGVVSAADLQIVDAWLKAGAPGSSSACAGQAGIKEPVASPWPPPGGCDSIYKITSHGEGGVAAPFVVQPREETHPQVQVDAPWGNERVQAIAFRPVTDNKLVLHHWILYSNQGSGALAGNGAFLTGWAPGDDERPPMPSDVGLEMPTGPGSMHLDMHYNSLTATKSENDQSGVEVCVVKGTNLRKNPAAVTMSLSVLGFPLAPANNPHYEATSVCNVTATKPVHIMTAAPHAHRLAVHTRFTVTKKSGQKIVMLDHPFVYGEQGSYGLDPEVVVETGDKIETTCVYNNPTSLSVNFGPNTADEMCFNFAMYYPSGAFSCGSSLGGLLGL